MGVYKSAKQHAWSARITEAEKSSSRKWKGINVKYGISSPVNKPRSCKKG